MNIIKQNKTYKSDKRKINMNKLTKIVLTGATIVGFGITWALGNTLYKQHILEHPLYTIEVTVEQGDTLWDYAARIRDRCLKGFNVENIIEQIALINERGEIFGDDRYKIHKGKKIKFPVYCKQF